MQLRFATNISVEQYIQQEAWRDAKLDQCPLHPAIDGGKADAESMGKLFLDEFQFQAYRL